MRLFKGAAALVLLLFVTACGSQKADPEAGATPSAAPAASGTEAESLATADYNLGDVEFATVVDLKVATRSLAPPMRYEELKTLRGTIAVANASVPAPHPAELWLTSTIKSVSAYRASDAVLVKEVVTAEGVAEPLATKTYVWSGADAKNNPQSIDINLMEHLNPVPKSVLVQTKLTIVWFPNTNPMTIVPETADLSKGQSQEKLSNPLRINFE